MILLKFFLEYKHAIMAKIFRTNEIIMTKRHIIFILLSIMLLTHCASYDFSRRVSQQGNLLSPSRIAKLHTGMNKEAVAIIMGTSLLSPTFNNDRLDYAYTWHKGTDRLQKKKLILTFQHDVLTRIEHTP